MCTDLSVTPDQVVRQRLFDASLSHIRAQGKPSLIGTSCVYRGPNGEGCAAAPFITDYVAEMENKNWYSVSGAFPARVTAEAREHDMFVTELQRAHDSASTAFDSEGERINVSDSDFLTEYESRMEQIAYRYTLNYQKPRKEPVFAGCGADSSLASF